MSRQGHLRLACSTGPRSSYILEAVDKNGPEVSGEKRTERFYSEFGRRVCNARVKAGLTQAELADHLGLTRSSIANLESGRQRIQVHLLPTLSRVLSTPFESLLPNGEGEPQGRDEALVGVSFDKISETAQRFVTDALRIASSGTSDGATQQS